MGFASLKGMTNIFNLSGSKNWSLMLVFLNPSLYRSYGGFLQSLNITRILFEVGGILKNLSSLDCSS